MQWPTKKPRLRGLIAYNKKGKKKNYAIIINSSLIQTIYNSFYWLFKQLNFNIRQTTIFIPVR